MVDYFTPGFAGASPRTRRPGATRSINAPCHQESWSPGCAPCAHRQLHRQCDTDGLGAPTAWTPTTATRSLISHRVNLPPETSEWANDTIRISARPNFESPKGPTPAVSGAYWEG
ncbi:hypothetical protein GCM10009665_16790 [Kitasatospora nipponensis]|uniref:Uncharacterized protein n=1 Tax=Kitasatospora nipponensis TaxID=258049 RepID=A0ABP4GJD3_9ACTN